MTVKCRFVVLLLLTPAILGWNAAAVEKGVEIWNYTTPGRVNSISLLNGSAVPYEGVSFRDMSQTGTPTVVVGCEDNFVYALDNNGAELWTYQTGGSVKSVYASPDGRIVAGSMDGFIYLLSREGELEWMRHIPSYVGYGQAVHRAGDRIAVGSMDGSVYTFNTNGVFLWHYKTDSYVLSTRIVDGRIIAVSDKSVYLLDHEGNLKKKIDTETYIMTDYVTDSHIALNTEGSKLTVLDVDGNFLWNHTEKDFFGPIHVTKDSVTVGSRNGTIYFFNVNGTLLWRKDLDKSVVAVYATDEYVAGSSLNNVLYVFDNKGKVKGVYGLNRHAATLAGKENMLFAGTIEGEVHAIEFTEKNPIMSVFAIVIMILMILTAVFMLIKSWSY